MMDEQYSLDGFEKQEGKLWLPETPNEVLHGAVVGIDEEGKWGVQYDVSIAPNNVKTTPSHAALQSLLSSAEVGDIVHIIYKGVSMNPQNQPTKRYEVYIKKQKVDKK